MKRLFTLFLAIIMLAFSTSCGAGDANTSDDKVLPIEEVNKQSQIVVYEDNTLTVTYMGLDNVAGQIGMAFSLENKGNQEITVLPLNGSVNDVMVLFVSGTLATVQPGKVFNQVWLANPQVIGISDISEVYEIEFTLNFGDTETKTITITP